MKKLILSALMVLSCGVLFAADTDMYLFWMIDDEATFGGGTKTDLTGYTARISDGNGGFLNLYTKPGGTSYTGATGVDASIPFGYEMVAGIGGYSSGSFIVELLQGDDIVYQSESLSYGSLVQYMSSMSGMARPAETYAVTAFTAVPEPTSGLLLLLGVAGLALRRKKMQKA